MSLIRILLLTLISNTNTVYGSDLPKSFPKYCQGTSNPCQTDAQCASAQSQFRDQLSSILCTYPYEETAAESPDQDKKVQVFIMMGQSNMVGFGQVKPKDTLGTLLHSISQGKFSHLLHSVENESNEKIWMERKDVRIVSRRGFRHVQESGPSNLKVGWNGDDTFIGPEVQFGNIMGHVFDNPVLIIKVGTGNRAIGWDFLPPGSERFTYNDGGETLSYPGHGECPESSLYSSISAVQDDCASCKGNLFHCPVFWPAKTECLSSCGIGWYAGLQFDEDLQNTKTILNNIKEYYPEYQDQGFEIGGFVFWQGFRDAQKEAHSSRYNINMKRFIESLSENYMEYQGSKKFVHATIAFGGCDEYDEDEYVDGYTGNEEVIYNAQRAISGEHSKDFEGKVKVVNARSYWRNDTISPVKSRSHYNHNADTYMDVGNALGWAMVDLLFNLTEYVEDQCENSSPVVPSSPSVSLIPTQDPTTHSSTPCDDDPSFQMTRKGNNSVNKFVFCNWITRTTNAGFRRKKYCLGQALESCKYSCGRCPSSCVDSPTFSWSATNGDARNCNWIVNPNRKRFKKRQRNICNRELSGSFVKDECPFACGACSTVV